MEITPNSDIQPEIEQPGLSDLREAVANTVWRKLPERTTIIRDALAGLNSAIGSAPDGMANSLLAGVNPVYGLYASMIGPVAGALFSSTQLMIVSSTSAAALGANQALIGLSGADRDRALFALVILVGVFQVIFGLFKVGKLFRFVSYSVMTGFLTGVAALMILSQIPTITGIEAEGANKLAQAIQVLLNIRQINLVTFGLALLALAAIVLLPRTPLRPVASLIAIIIPSALAVFFGWGNVQTVGGVSQIPRGLPSLVLPGLSDFTPGVATGALAVAVITMIQGAGVSQSVPNPDGKPRSASRDVLAQGAANVVTGFLRGLPVGGSLSATALSVIAGPRTRWSAIFSGLWMAAIVLIFPGLIVYLVMPALGALLIHAGWRTIKTEEWLAIWETGWASRLAAVSTFLATLTLPIEIAVSIGVVLSALINLNELSTDISVVELTRRPDGVIEEHKRPKRLKSDQVTVLDIYGPLFYASARTLGRLLPETRGAQNPAVVLRLRGQTHMGATLIDVLSDYAQELKAVNGRLYLSGVHASAFEQLVGSGRLSRLSADLAYKATPLRGESTREAVADAHQWLTDIKESDRDDRLE